MDNLTTYRFVKRGELRINDQYLLVADPCYLNEDLMTIVWVRNWFKKTANCFIVDSEKDPNRARCQIVTLRDTPPLELLQPLLTGSFAYIDICAVDSGMTLFASGEVEKTYSRAPKTGIRENGRVFIEHTFMGDGQPPVAVWAENGLIHTVAIITDWGYYPEGQFFWAGTAR